MEGGGGGGRERGLKRECCMQCLRPFITAPTPAGVLTNSVHLISEGCTNIKNAGL